MAKKPLAKPMRPQWKVFALCYLANGQNVTAAYKEAYPGMKSDNGAAVNGSKLLTNAQIARFIEARLEKVLAKHEATADEAMEVITRVTRVDVRKIYDAKGKPIPVKDWPDELALAVKSIKGDGTIVFYDKMRGAELIAEAAGRIRKSKTGKDPNKLTLEQVLGASRTA